MKLPAVLTTAAIVAGFVPFGQAVCPDGDIALINQDPDNKNVSTTFQSANSFATYFEMIRFGRSLRTTAAVSLLARTTRHVDGLAMPM